MAYDDDVVLVAQMLRDVLLKVPDRIQLSAVGEAIAEHFAFATAYLVLEKPVEERNAYLDTILENVKRATIGKIEEIIRDDPDYTEEAEKEEENKTVTIH